ncbi:hypothetical protein LCGC14_1749680 [marine sediment metagenome]|uniref:Uncharacterized protein n=1 Tax=marine sediment metagenome TaxID=412755 RepID=A0A0F9H4C0_9ZZZZ
MSIENSIYIYAAKREISHISRDLIIDTLSDHNKIILEIYKTIFPVLRKNSKYRLPTNLIPLIIFIYFRLHDLVITKSQIISESRISFSDFNDFIMQLIIFLRRGIT